MPASSASAPTRPACSWSKLGAPLLVALIASIGVTALFGAVLALARAARHRPYLAMVTLAFGTIVQILINEMDFLTGGPMGITLTKPPLFGHKLDEREFFWLVAVLMVVALIVVHRTPALAPRARLRGAARQSGSPPTAWAWSVYRYKVFAFVISAGFAGLAGSLYAYSEQYISPNTYNFELTVLFLLAVIMGGRKSRIGSLVGATIIVLLPKLLDDLSLFRYVSIGLAVLVIATALIGIRRGRVTPRQMAIPVVGSIALAGLSFVLQTMTDWRLSIFGVIMLFVVYYLQDGIVGFVRSALNLARPKPEGARWPARGWRAMRSRRRRPRAAARSSTRPAC